MADAIDEKINNLPKEEKDKVLPVLSAIFG
jgi:hypothetical protein